MPRSHCGTESMVLVLSGKFIPPCVVAVQSLSRVWLFAIPWTAAHQASLSFTISQSLLRLMSIESVMPSNHLILFQLLLLLSSVFPSIQVFSSEPAPKYWHFSISPSNEYSGFISLGLTGLTSLLSKGLPRVFSSTRVWKHQFFGAQPSLQSNSRIHTWQLIKP